MISIDLLYSKLICAVHQFASLPAVDLLSYARLCSASNSFENG